VPQKADKHATGDRHSTGAIDWCALFPDTISHILSPPPAPRLSPAFSLPPSLHPPASLLPPSTSFPCIPSCIPSFVPPSVLLKNFF
jgi:hypothetical protein